MINAISFRRWWDVFHSEDKVVEIRLIGAKDGKEIILSGYFTDCESALAAIQEESGTFNVFSPFNPILPACENRAQLGCFRRLTRNEPSTSDNDIERRNWLMVDFDPVRPTGTNSSDAEKAKALVTMKQVGVFLRDRGFTAPVVVMSGNGYHLYYRINIPNNDDCKDLLQRCLEVLALFFGNDSVDIDRQVFNAARITKVVGSISHKGRNTKDRPCREAAFVKVPDEITITPVEVLQRLADEMPKKEAPSSWNGYRDDFNIDDFIREHGIAVASEKSMKGGGRKIILESCPFDSSHKAPDSAIFVLPSGAIGFKCLHNSCSHYTWHDVRVHYDPSAYTRNERANYNKRRSYYSQDEKPQPAPLSETPDKGKKWLSMSEIQWQDPNSLQYIPSGIIELDDKIGGFALGDVTIISGIAGAGKTTLLDFIILSALQRGYKAAVWSGELMASRFKQWFNQAAAGANFVERNYTHGNYYCPQSISVQIDQWTQGRLFLYNNSYGNKSSQIITDIRDCIERNGTQLICIDNKMAMSLDSYEGDKNERDAGLINELKDLAIAAQIHIILVCHPRKEMMNTLLRMESIAGNSDLYNAAANVLLCHRVGRDFNRRAKEFYGKDTLDTIEAQRYDNVIEVAKNRSHGAKDLITGMYYEEKSRRLLNYVGEYVVYGWQPDYQPPQEIITDDKPNVALPYKDNDDIDDEDLPYDPGC